MADIDSLREQLIEELWIPIIKEAGAHFYRRRKNKKMKLFTLTDGVAFRELIRLEEEKLIQRGDAVLWVNNMIKAVRAETEARGIVLSGSICDEAVLDVSGQLNPSFPCDILNLDFSSQEPDSNNSSIEKELEKAEHFINLQNQKHCNGFVVLQTMIINTAALNRDGVKRGSDAMLENGWNGLTVANFTQPVSDNSQKFDFIKHVLQSLCQKYKYRILKITFSTKIIDSNQQLCSIAGILQR